MVENTTNVKLICPTCKQAVSKDHIDDVGQQWYICENGHQMIKPIEKMEPQANDTRLKNYCETCNSEVTLDKIDDVGLHFYSCKKCGLITKTKIVVIADDYTTFYCPECQCPTIRQTDDSYICKVFKHKTKTALTRKEYEAYIKGCAITARTVKESDKALEKALGQVQNKKESQADRLYKLVQSNDIEFFHDQNKIEYARIPVITRKINGTNDINGISGNLLPSSILKNEGESQPDTSPETSENIVNIVNTVSAYQTVRLKEEKFKSYLAYLLYESEEKIVNNESISQVILLLKFNASQGKSYHLYNRVASDPSGDGSIWIDIADEQNQAYHITKDGWSIETNTPIIFRRFEHQKALAIAVKGGDPKKLLPFVNVGANKNSELTKHRQLLLLVQTASYAIPDIAHPINAMFGCPGSHKSTAQRFIREIFDPSSVELINRLPRDENAALQVLDHHYIPVFDNLDYLPRWFSDMLCGAVTGTGMESRALYTDDDSFIRSFKRCILLNGLNLPATKGDLLNRTVMHPTEPTIERRTEAELNAEYLKVLPEILGGFLDAISKTLKIKETVIPQKMFRLADFTEWGCALTVALGEKSENFINAMDENLNSQNASDIENNVVADAFLAYCSESLDFSGATESTPKSMMPELVFKAVTAKAENLGVSTKNTKRWPSAPNTFTRKLNDSKNAIIACGWNYEIVHNGKNREMQIWHTKDVKPADDGKPKFVYEQIQPAEACGFCGNNAVEFIVKSPSNETQRRCEGCFRKLSKEFSGIKFVLKEGEL